MKSNNLLKILVFPCGSEIGLEVRRSLKFSRHVELIGGSSIEDHGAFVYKNYVGQLPFASDENFEKVIQDVVVEHGIDAIYPTMDSVITIFSAMADRLPCKVIGSPHLTNELVLSKSKTYSFFSGIIPVPKVFESLTQVNDFPVFSKPDVGYGSKGIKVLNNETELEEWSYSHPDSILVEYLPGPEYTVDCFSSKSGDLLFAEPRKRGRIQKGISVNTFPVPELKQQAWELALAIHENLNLRGAWFFQLKERSSGELVLMEIATRLAGSSSVFRYAGVNFALMSIFDAFDFSVGVLRNPNQIVLDRAFNQCLKIEIEYRVVYVDLDDCLILEDQVNTELLAFLFQAINRKVKVVLITKHALDLEITLKKFRLSTIFDECIHLKNEQEKSEFMSESSAIFIDDSFIERQKVAERLNIPVFAPDAVSGLYQP